MISDTERSNLKLFTSGSSGALNSLSETTSNLVIVEGNLERNWDEIEKFSTTLTLDDISRERLMERYGSSVRTEDESQDDESTADVEET